MSWFVFSVICLLGWGFADLFYKKGTDDEDRYSHLKIAVWVGLIMGATSVVLLLFHMSETEMTFSGLMKNALSYAPASLCYIISMIIGYAGLRYLELSIVSPIQNASGALSAICMLVFFLATGRFTDFTDAFSTLDIIGTILIVIGVIALAVVENKLSRKSADASSASAQSADTDNSDRRYRFGTLALLFPLLYCLFDTIGTAADGIILDEEKGLGLGEMDVIILYGLTFLLVGLGCWLYILIRSHKPYNPFRRSEVSKGIAACCEEFGQVFYVFAMARKPVIAAPMVASYCIVSVILSRIFVKERLRASQYACVISVIVGIVILGISEGIASM